MIEQLARAFSRIGATVKFAVPDYRHPDLPFVLRDAGDECYVLDLNKARGGVYGIQEVRPAKQALILREAGEVLRYHLCHHDGDGWRVGWPTSGRRAKTIEAALRPEPAEVVRPPARPPRLTLVPAPTFQPATDVRRREEPPVQRCRRLGFVAQYECRVESATVFVGRDHPNGVAEQEWRELRERDAAGFRRQRWRRVTPARIYVRGWLWRPDVALTTLRTWHEARIQPAG